MTEAEWLSAERPYDLIYHPQCRSDRKRRLLACACTRRVLRFLPEERFAWAVAECERYADGEVEWKALLAARKVVRAADADLRATGGLEHQTQAAGGVRAVTEKEFMQFKMAIEYAQHALGAYSRPDFTGGCAREAAEQVVLARDVFRNPFHPVTFDPPWRTEAVVALARSMYDSRDFTPTPVLADALEDAGCTEADVLAHCRGDGPHVRGCWVVDLVLGKS
jgi:hypothetical protein